MSEPAPFMPTWQARSGTFGSAEQDPQVQAKRGHGACRMSRGAPVALRDHWRQEQATARVPDGAGVRNALAPVDWFSQTLH